MIGLSSAAALGVTGALNKERKQEDKGPIHIWTSLTCLEGSVYRLRTRRRSAALLSAGCAGAWALKVAL